MYFRVVRGRALPGKANEFAERWEAFAGSAMPSMPGFRHAYLASNSETNNIIAVTVWDTPPDPEQAQQREQQMRERASDILAEGPEAENYEVLAELSPD